MKIYFITMDITIMRFMTYVKTRYGSHKTVIYMFGEFGKKDTLNLFLIPYRGTSYHLTTVSLLLSFL